MLEQNLEITHSVLNFFESLPDTLKTQVFESYFKKHQEKLEELIFYLECKERKENMELVGGNNLFDVLKERL